MPSSSSRMGSNRSQIGVMSTVRYAGKFAKGKISPRKFMPNLTKKSNKKAY